MAGPSFLAATVRTCHNLLTVIRCHSTYHDFALVPLQEKDRIDIGWSSVAVKLSAELVAASLYCWTLLAPALFPERDFS